jgi:hypothetical protein
MVTSRNNSRTTVAPGSRRLPLCPGGRRLAGPDRLPPGWAAGRGQRRDRLLAAAALGQLGAGADLVKLYLDGPDGDSSPFHRRRGPPHRRGGPCPRGHGDRHSSLLPGARAGVAAGWMPWSTGSGWRPTWPGSWPPLGTALVATLAVLESWASFGATTRLAAFASAEGGRGWPSGGRRRMSRSGSPMPRGCCLAPGPTSAAAGCGPTSSPGRVRRWSPPGWSPMTPWPRPPSTAGGCWASPAPASSPRAAPADFLLVHGDPCRSRGRCGGGGAPAGNPLSTHSAVATTSSHLPIHPTGDAAKAPGAPSRRTCPLCLKPYRRVRRVVSLESPSRALSGRGTARMRRPERSHQPRRRGEAA